MKYKAMKRDGKYIFAGFSNPPPQAVGDVVEEYDDIQPSIVAAVIANRPKERSWQDEIAELKAALQAKGVL